MKQTTRKKKTVKVFGDLKRSLQEALAYEQSKMMGDNQKSRATTIRIPDQRQ
jgi:hypothetical protein